MKDPSRCIIPQLLLAAGGSRRMGQPKALLPWGEQTLIEHRIGTLLQTEQPVVVILGAESEQILPVVKRSPVRFLVNTNWKAGIAGSISFGVSRLTEVFPDACGVLITLLDQPLLTHLHFEKMFEVFQPGSHQIVVSQSASGWRGVPVLFDSFYFESLQSLKGDEGAKTVVRQFQEAVTLVDSGEVLDDMDTPEAYQQLKNYAPQDPGANPRPGGTTSSPGP